VYPSKKGVSYKARAMMMVPVLTSFLLLSGCALSGHPGVQPENYQYTKQVFDVTFGWNKSLTGDGMTIDGYARNNRYFIISGLELRVSLVSGEGKEKAK